MRCTFKCCWQTNRQTPGARVTTLPRCRDIITRTVAIPHSAEPHSNFVHLWQLIRLYSIIRLWSVSCILAMGWAWRCLISLAIYGHFCLSSVLWYWYRILRLFVTANDNFLPCDMEAVQHLQQFSWIQFKLKKPGSAVSPALLVECGTALFYFLYLILYGNVVDVFCSDFHSLTQHSESLHDTSQSQLAAQHVDHTRNVDHTEPADHIQDMDEVQAADESSVTSLSIRDDVSSLSLQSSASLASRNLSSLASELSTRANQVSAVQESSSSHSSQTVVYCRTSENTATASTDTHCEHTPVTSHPARPPDFTSIEIPMREYPPELCQRHYDAVLISTTEDKHIATVFKYVLTEFITLEVCTCCRCV